MTASNTESEWGKLFAIASGSALMASVLLLAPAVAGQLITKLGFTEVQVGWTISAELAGLSLASFPAFYWLKRYGWQRVLFFSLLMVAAGNLLSTQLTSFTALATVRFITALFAGNVMVITMQTAASMANPTRSYSVWVIGQLLLGAVGLALLPMLFAAYDLAALYMLLAVFSLALLATIRFYPNGFDNPTQVTSQSSALPLPILIGALLGLTAFYIAIGGVWTFTEQLAIATIDHGDEAEFRQRVGLVLSIATVAGIVSALVASLLGNSQARNRWMLLGSLMLSVAIAMPIFTIDFLVFAIGVVLFKFAWTFTLPFILAGFAKLDSSGFLVTASNIIIGLGLAFGPVIAGYLIGSDGGFTLMSVVMLFVSLAASGFLVMAMRMGGR